MHRCVALAVLVLGFGSACTDPACGYGGPGCGLPGLQLCEGQGAWTPGRTLTAIATFHDDTGWHRSSITSFSTSTPAVLSVAKGSGLGELDITTVAVGAGRVSLGLMGWEGQTFTWALDVTTDGARDAGEPSRIARGLPDGGACVSEPLVPVR